MRALLGLGVAAALVAGCGADDPAAADELSAAVEETAAAGSSRIALTADDSGAGEIEGAADYREDEARYTWTDRDGTGEMRLVDDTLYTRADGLHDGETWISQPAPDGDRGGSFDALLQPFPFIDPARMLEQVERAAVKTDRLGERGIRGVPAQGYRLTVDIAKLIESAPTHDREAFRHDLAQRAEKTTPVEVWLDDAGRALRIAVAWEGSGTTLDFYDYGIAVDVEAPPADDTISKHELEAAQTTTETEEMP